MATVLITGSVLGALLAGSLSFSLVVDRQAHVVRQKALKSNWQGARMRKGQGGALEDFLLERLSRFNLADVNATPVSFLEQGSHHSSARIAQRLRLAGMSDIAPASALRWRLRIAAISTACLAIAGSFFSLLAVVVGALVGALVGWRSLHWALSKRIVQRKKEIEAHISEAIEVLCLGLRAGLSFERSLELYCVNFPTQLAGDFASAKQIWNTGLLSREDALRNLAASYDSLILGRVVDSMVRSLRFGSPLADSLEDLAHEARRVHRLQVEEAVMKAPVKMMMPIGLLILPSMMLLVMGPIMLELVNGF